MPRLRFVTLAGALAIAFSLGLYVPTFKHTWAFDDIDYVNLCAGMLSGRVGVWSALFHPHAEHVVAGFEALFFPYLRLFGVNALPWRVGVALVHACSAIALGLLARRYAGSARAGIAAVVVYVGACGFSSMWVWFPSGATVPLLMALLTGGAALLAWRDRLRWRRLAAGVAVVLALLTESAFAPMALLPAAIDEYERRKEGGRGIGGFTMGTLAAIAGVVALVATLSRNGSARVSIDLGRGLPRAAFLLLAAPFRFFFPGLPIVARSDARIAVLGCVLGVTLAAVAAALLVVLWRRGAPPLALVAGLSLPGPLGVLVLIGLGRWRASYPSLYETDRYFFPLLVPLALLAGAVAGSVSRVAASVAGALPGGARGGPGGGAGTAAPGHARQHPEFRVHHPSRAAGVAGAVDGAAGASRSDGDPESGSLVFRSAQRPHEHGRPDGVALHTLRAIAPGGAHGECRGGSAPRCRARSVGTRVGSAGAVPARRRRANRQYRPAMGRRLRQGRLRRSRDRRLLRLGEAVPMDGETR